MIGSRDSLSTALPIHPIEAHLHAQSSWEEFHIPTRLREFRPADEFAVCVDTERDFGPDGCVPACSSAEVWVVHGETVGDERRKVADQFPPADRTHVQDVEPAIRKAGVVGDREPSFPLSEVDRERERRSYRLDIIQTNSDIGRVKVPCHRAKERQAV